MMGDIDWFGTIFGAVPEGDISWNARVAKAMIRIGLAPVLIRPGTKLPACTLNAADAKRADVAAQDAAKERGVSNYGKVRHECGVHHALTHEDHLNHKKVKDLLESGANLAVSLGGRVTETVKDQKGKIVRDDDGNKVVRDITKRVMLADVDTDAERCAFLADWNAHGGHVDENTPLTVVSPGVYDTTAETWKHKNGGHIWFDVPDHVELPDAKGKASWCGCHQFAMPGCEKSWSLFWGTGYVLVPPSVRPEGAYRVTGGVLEAPAWLIKIARESVNVTAPSNGTGELNFDDGDPINAWASATSWATLLTEDGWAEHGVDSCGCTTWTLPGGASNPKSATAHEVGCGRVPTDGGHGPMHIWSDALRPGGKDTLSKLSYVAHMRHGGDMSAAMSALGVARTRRDEMFDGLDVLGKASAPAGSGALPEQKPEDAVQVPDIGEFWDARPALRNIHDLAWSEMCAPWAVLGAVLGYVTALTPPRVKANDMSLNLYVGLVGPSGSGKDTAIKAARKWIGDLVGDGRLYQRTIGSGQGLESAFVNRVKDKRDDGDVVYVNRQIRESALVKVSEVDQISSHAKQQASTLVANLRSAWMAQALGGMYKDTTKDIAVGEDTYRLSMIVNIQPHRARPLIDDVTGGLPQRFLWLPTTDKNTPDDFRSYRPEPMEWKPPVKCRDMSDPFVIGEDAHHDPDVEMEVCQKALDEIDAGRLARARGTWEGDALTTHDDLGRLKVAAALALLDGRTDVREADWDLAGVVARVSRFVRGRVVHGLEDEGRRKREAENRAQAEAAVEVEKAKAASALDQAKAKVRSVLARQSAGEWIKAAKVRGSITRSARVLFEDAANELVNEGVAEREDRETGFVLRLKE